MVHNLFYCGISRQGNNNSGFKSVQLSLRSFLGLESREQQPVVHKSDPAHRFYPAYHMGIAQSRGQPEMPHSQYKPNSHAKTRHPTSCYCLMDLGWHELSSSAPPIPKGLPTKQWLSIPRQSVGMGRSPALWCFVASCLAAWWGAK